MKNILKIIINLIKVIVVSFIVFVAFYTTKGKLVTIKYGHLKTVSTYTKFITVGQVLEQESIKLDELDEYDFNVNDLTFNDMNLNVDVIREVYDKKQEIKNFTSTTVRSNLVPLFQTKVIKQGQKEVIEKTFKTIYKNGEAQSTELVKTDKLNDLVNEVVGIGTGNPEVFWGTMTGYSVECVGCTGALYHPSYHNGKKEWLTVSKKNIYFNLSNGKVTNKLCNNCIYIMAADKRIPGGTIIELTLPRNSVIRSSKIRAIVLDVGSAIKGKTGDLLFKNDAATFKEGRIYSVKYTIIRWGWWNQ